MTQTQLVRRVLKPVVFVAALGPFLWLVYNAFWGDLGVNPVETITNETGIWTLRLLAASIAITPIRWLTKWNPIINLRRMVGLFAFFYGTVHFMIYFVLDRSLMFDGLWEDIVKRPYITVGMLAFTILVPLAATSNNAMIRRLGARAWQRLHKLVYVATAAAAIHFVMLVKSWWTPEPAIYATLVTALLIMRLWLHAQKRLWPKPRPVSRPVSAEG